MRRRSGRDSGSAPARLVTCQRTSVRLTARGCTTPIVGRSLESQPKRAQAPSVDGGGLEVESLRTDNVASISFSVRPGEIVGLFGLLGCGRSDVALAVAGATPSVSRMTLDGVGYAPRSVASAIRSGVAFIPPDRATQAIFPILSAEDNVVLPIMRRLAEWGLRRRRRERLDTSQIEAADPAAPQTSGHLSDPLRTAVGVAGGVGGRSVPRRIADRVINAVGEPACEARGQASVSIMGLSRVAGQIRLLVLDELETRAVAVGRACGCCTGRLRALAARGLAVLRSSEKGGESVRAWR